MTQGPIAAEDEHDEDALHPVPGVVITYLAGKCPVQAEGLIDGQPFYFKSRGERWLIGVGGDPVSAPAWNYHQPYQAPDGESAGYMPLEVAVLMIVYAAGRYAGRKGA